MNPRYGGFTKKPKLYISRHKLAGVCATEVKIRFNLRRGISRQGPKIVIFSRSCSTFLFDSIGPGVKNLITMNSSQGGFTKRPTMNISGLKPAGFAETGVKMRFNLRGGIST